MNKLYAFTTGLALALASIGASAQEGVTVTLDPAPGTFEELPTTISLTFEGEIDGQAITSLKKNIIGGNPALLVNPAGQKNECQGVFSDNTVTLTMPKSSATFDNTLSGEYTLSLRTGGFNYIMEDGTKVKPSEMSWTYTLGSMPQEGLTVTIDPAPGTYEELPSSFTLTFDGELDGKTLAFVSKNTLVQTCRIVDPNGKALRLTGAFETGSKSVTVNLPASPGEFNPQLNGDYVLELQAGGVYYNWEDGTKEKCEKREYTYTQQSESIIDPADQDVVYDITVIKTVPSTPVDISMKTFETLQIIFDKGGLQAKEDATVSITGPSYSYTVPLQYIMTGTDATYFKGLFPNDPEYNGEYILHIDQGVVGDAIWMANNEKGHANAEVNYTIVVEGGKDISEMTKDLSFTPVISPAQGGKVSVLDKITFTFPEKVYYNESTTIQVGKVVDLQSGSSTPFATATLSRISDTEVELVLDQIPTSKASYQIKLAEEIFWNEAAEQNAEGAKYNPAMSLSWMLVPESSVTVNVVSHTPATDAYVGAFNGTEDIVIDTDNNDAVASMRLTVTGYELENDMTMPETILNDVESTAKTASGAICWGAGAESILLKQGFYYKVDYKLYNTAGNEIAYGSFDFYGSGTDGVEGIEAENAGAEVIYNLQGVRVNRTAAELPAGIYIINGKKLVVK